MAYDVFEFALKGLGTSLNEMKSGWHGDRWRASTPTSCFCSAMFQPLAMLPVCINWTREIEGHFTGGVRRVAQVKALGLTEI